MHGCCNITIPRHELIRIEVLRRGVWGESTQHDFYGVNTGGVGDDVPCDGFAIERHRLDASLHAVGVLHRDVELGTTEQSPGPPPNLPRLALDALQVEGAAVVEAPRDGAVDLRFYRTLIRNGVREALSGDPKTSKDDYDAMLELEIAGDGTVQRARLAASTGDRERDRAIVDAVQGLALDQPPPVDLPHPVRVDVKSRKRP